MAAQRAGESESAFAFRIWLSLGRGRRSLQGVVDATAQGIHRVQRWAIAEDWQGKAEAWDKAQRDKAAEHNPRADHAWLLQSVRDLVEGEVAKLLAMSRSRADAVLSVPALAKLMEKTVVLDRLIRDQSTANLGGDDWEEALDDAPEDALRALADRLPPAGGV